MNVLGFFTFRGAHNSSAAIVCNGKLVAAAEEERFSRRKHDGSIPLSAIEFCLAEAGLRFRDIDLIAFPDTPFRTGPDSAHAAVETELLKELRAAGRVSGASLLHKRALDAWLHAGLPLPNLGMNPIVAAGLALVRERFGKLPPLRFVDHHKAHAAAAFFTSGLDSAAVATIDGRGGNYATAIWHARGKDLKRIAGEPYCNSLGLFYEDCSEYLGLGRLNPGKTMGLAPYGHPDILADAVSHLLSTRDGRLYRYRRPPNEDLIGFPRRTSEPVNTPPFTHFAAASQNALETAVRKIAVAALELTGESALCLGGGTAYNCTSNGTLRESAVGSPLWIFPAAGDAGLSVGAALFSAAERGDDCGERLPHAFWGPDYNEAECEAALQDEPDLAMERRDDGTAHAASLLAHGEILGWFAGRMELGPRALGNRSILADPRSIAIRDRVNDIKGRERWRPLAPAVLASRADEFFDIADASEFMLFATRVRASKQSLVRGIVHVDGSARPQTVTRTQNPLLHDLIAQFERLTGVPMLINTSFNDAAEPIVCSPRDAVSTFKRTALDALVMGQLVVRRR